ncbi:hypothetical protein N9B20_04595, partial [Mariniblastus sp.]|nr:hypothetical protein [Mariniblastus sp.]
MIIAAWFIVPSLYATRDFRFLVVAATAIWIVFEYANNPVDFLKFDWSKIALTATIAILILGEYASGGTAGLRSAISLVIALSLVFIGTRMIKRPYHEFYWVAIAI